MVMSPNKAKELTNDEKNLVSKLEVEIDIKIIAEAQKNKYVVHYEHPDNIGVRVHNEIAGIYQEAGWQVDECYRAGRSFITLQLEVKEP